MAHRGGENTAIEEERRERGGTHTAQETPGGGRGEEGEGDREPGQKSPIRERVTGPRCVQHAWAHTGECALLASAVGVLCTCVRGGHTV
jgi:hypothetical protein